MEYYEFYSVPNRQVVASPSFHVVTSEPVTTRRRYSVSTVSRQRDLGLDGSGPMFEEPIVYQSRAPVLSHHVAHRGPHMATHHVPAARVRVTASPARVVVSTCDTVITLYRT